MSRSVKVVYPANPQEPTVKELAAGVDVTAALQPVDKFTQAMAALGLSAEEGLEALQVYASLYKSPKEELLWRLNEQVQQRDPGQPVNWRGLS